MHQIFMRGEHFKENRIILRIQDFMLTMMSYSASNDMFMLFQLIANRTFLPSVFFRPYDNGLLTILLAQSAGLIMKIIKT